MTPEEVGSPTLTPKLRFPEFDGLPLNDVRLGDVTAQSADKNGSDQPKFMVMGVSKTDGIVPMVERLIASDATRYKIVRRNWFAYNPMRLNIGSIARWQGDSDILVSPDYVVFRCKTTGSSRLDPTYLDLFRQSEAWEGFVSEKGDGGVRVRVYYKDLARLQLALPSLEEQHKIADCLSSVDALIEAQGRKVEVLKAHKKGIMQQLFPQEGETKPNLRFPEFRDVEEWDSTVLGKLSEVVRGGSPRPIDGFMTTAPDGLNWLKIGDVDKEAKFVTKTADKVRRDALNKTRVVSPGDLILSNSMSFGRPYILQISTCIHDGWIAVRKIDEKLVPDFLYYFILSPSSQSYFLDNAAGSGVQNLNANIIKSLAVHFPCRDEQKRIAGVLASLDDLIAAETRKLGTLKTHKKGLMQQLFPSVREADA